MSAVDTAGSRGGVDPAGSPGAASGSAPAIVCKALTKRYGSVSAVSDLNLTVGRGEVFGLLGPNGAGKTTTILMLLGLTEPTAGSVRVLGMDPARRAIEVKSRVGYLPDAVGFYPAMTGRENLRYTARLNGLGRAAGERRIAEVLDTVGLTSRGDDRTGTYSRGMGQRLGIADALIKNPEVLILDEPTVGLDPQAAEMILGTITTLAGEQGVTVLLSSHLLTQVQAVCHRVGIFVRGSLVAAGTIDDLAERHGGRIVIEVATSRGDPSSILQRLPGVIEVQRDGDVWAVGTQQDIRGDIATAVTSAGFTVVHLRRRSEELGSLYRRYFTQGAS